MSDEKITLIRDPKNRTVTDPEVHDRMTYHAPSQEGIRRHSTLSVIFENVMQEVDAIVPPGREKSLALTKLEEAKMWASAGVARNPRTV